MVATLAERGVVRVVGPDATDYLQGQVSQDIPAIEVGTSAWSLVLQPTGKLTAWFRIHRVGEDEYLLDVEPESVEALVARLERFKLRTAVEFEPLAGWSMLSLRAGTSGSEAVRGARLTAEFEWPGFGGSDHLGPDVEAPEGVVLDPVAFEAGRIGAGVPRMGVDLDDETIPAEGGAPLIDLSVSFTKGCYTGQELVARIDSRGGNVPRPLRILRSASPITAGDEIRHAGDVVGEVTSAAGGVGLGRVLRKVEPGQHVEIGTASGTVTSR